MVNVLFFFYCLSFNLSLYPPSFSFLNKDINVYFQPLLEKPMHVPLNYLYNFIQNQIAYMCESISEHSICVIYF